MFIIADNHPPASQYDIAFDGKNPKDLTQDNQVVYVQFGDFAKAMDWLGQQDYTASLLMYNGDCGLSQNEFCYYFSSGFNMTNFMFWDDVIPDQLNRLYVQGLNVEHTQFACLPLGIMKSNVPKISRAMRLMGKVERQCLLYVNFDAKTCMFRRILTHGFFANKKWAMVEKGLSMAEYYGRLLGSHYVACPRGNGIDSFRVWESLYLGAFPIVTRSVMFEELAMFLPILVVDNWSDITQTYLIEQLPRLCEKNKWPEMLTQPFWNKHVREQRVLSSQQVYDRYQGIEKP